MELVVDEEAIAAPTPCVRCSAQSNLSIVGRCADCIGDLGLHHPDDYAVFKADVAAEFGRK